MEVLLLIIPNILFHPFLQVVTMEDCFFATQEQYEKPRYKLIWELGDLNETSRLVCNNYFWSYFS